MASRVDAIQVSQARLDALRGRQQDRLLGRLDRAWKSIVSKTENDFQVVPHLPTQTGVDVMIAIFCDFRQFSAKN
jgi:hypothetical protein